MSCLPTTQYGVNVYLKFRAKAWYFGQFDAPFLDCVCDLLDRADLSTHSYQLNDLACVVTILSAFLNAKDDNGVLECKWPGRNEDRNNYEADPYKGGYRNG